MLETCHGLRFLLSAFSTVWETLDLDYAGVVLDRVSGFVDSHRGLAVEEVSRGEVVLVEEDCDFVHFLIKDLE
jgi:hypothetical protein